MLSFNTVHAITEHLVAAAAPAAGPAPYRLTQAPVLLVVLDAHRPPAGPRLLRTLQIPLADDTAAHHPLALLLHHTAESLSRHGAAHPIMQTLRTLRIVGDRAPARDSQLAWATRYTDIDVSAGTPHLVERIEAIDVDGRSYQVSLAPGETSPVVHVDDRPDPHEFPAIAGLAALAAAATRLGFPGLPA